MLSTVLARTFTGYINSFIAYLLVFLFILLSANSSAKTITSAPLLNDPLLRQQRELYVEAKAALARNDRQRFLQIKTQLRDYSLHPYLVYSELAERLPSLPYLEIDNFLDEHKGTYLAQLLLRRWLFELAKQQHWHEYRSYFDPSLKQSGLRCLHLWSRLKTGERDVLRKVESLWNVGVSRSGQCNALFDEWKNAGYLTPELLWERHRKALKKRNLKLARYLGRIMPKTMKAKAALYREVHSNPKTLRDTSRFVASERFVKEIVLHGLHRFAGRDAQGAVFLWDTYRNKHSFSTAEKERITTRLAIQLARQNYIDKALALKPLEAVQGHSDYITSVLRTFLKTQRWQDIPSWIEQLPEQEQQSERWLYWKARALEYSSVANKTQAVCDQTKDSQTSSSTVDSLSQNKKPLVCPQSIYQQLSQQRSFYGFLAADILGRPYQMMDKPVEPHEQLLAGLHGHAGMQRARELFFLGKMSDARQEWRFSTKGLTYAQLLAAGKIAASWGWHRKGIESMTAARYWNDLNIRFPLAHTDLFDQAAKQTQLPSTLLLAIARQESAWASDAVSPAGAMGLMQIMPATARETAKKSGISHQNKKQLLHPEHNITLGSRYINQLLTKYDGNRLLAVAAYNAGPHRVNRWLQRSNKRLPYDVWVEVIPFNETRKYVQNVLSYSVVYSHQLGMSSQFITPKEAKRIL